MARKKILIVVSPGGHLYQALLLNKWWSKHTVVWVSLKSPDVTSLLKNQKIIYAYGPENRDIFNLFRNLRLAVKVLSEEKPDVVFSTGAGLAPPFIWVAFLKKVPTIYLEPFDFIHTPSLTARIILPFCSKLLVQHKSLIHTLKGSLYWGSTI